MNWKLSHLQGFYRSGVFTFSFKIGPAYPHEPPKVKFTMHLLCFIAAPKSFEEVPMLPKKDFVILFCHRWSVRQRFITPTLTLRAMSASTFSERWPKFISGMKTIFTILLKYLTSWLFYILGLETSVDNQFDSLWPSISLPGEILNFLCHSRWFVEQIIPTKSDTIWIFTFQEPNPEDPLNKEAAIELQSNRRVFEQNVQKTMKGDCLRIILYGYWISFSQVAPLTGSTSKDVSSDFEPKYPVLGQCVCNFVHGHAWCEEEDFFVT